MGLRAQPSAYPQFRKLTVMADGKLTGRSSDEPGGSVTIIRPSNGWRALNLRELWRFRELALFLAWRDVKVRYRQTALGVMWAVLQPLLVMLIFTAFLGKVVKVPTAGVPYPLFIYAALLPWTYFANAATGAAGSLVANERLVSKVYFPRMAIPLAPVLAGLVDFAAGGAVLVVILILTGSKPQVNLVFIPLFLLVTVLTSLAVSVWLAALNVQYRDVQYAVPFLVQVWFFATPVAYPVEMLPERFRIWSGLNPMTGVVEGFRWMLLGGGAPPWDLVAMSSLATMLVLVGGLFYFRRMERIFADVI